ncbi:DUF7373 family lipoprotein [Tsukamurella spumae]|uniref:Uncharacterized protein n=1 Tax=Tsukamurella spumae TaxID=44753 RepID=A0A846WZV6_9ACTN|nr:hypothetical protein [Tsukamurella spumae]NKY18473.1 hypothetical protein [Tsukamurella spumae]
MRIRVALVLASAALLAGCSTTVPGTAVVDPGAVPRPDYGSNRIEPRDVGTADTVLGLVLEGRRMAATAPLLFTIDPAIRYSSQVEAGQLNTGRNNVRFMVGQLGADAFRDHEVGFFIGASDQKPGVRSSSTTTSRGVTVGVLRMPSPARAAAAVTAGLRGREPDASADTPEKKTLAIPGYDTAIAYSQAFKTGTPNAAFLAYQQYVIFAYGAYSPAQIQKYFDAQIKGLGGFTPTPVDKVTTLPVDDSGVAKYTLPPSTEDPTRTGTLPIPVALQNQLDVTSAKNAFDDAGVDAVGVGNSTVYRAKDAAAAVRMQRSLVDDVRGFYSTNTPIAAKNIPGVVCMVLPMYPGSSVTTNWCIATAGRYVVEVAAGQQQQAVQRIGAEYLILRDAK